MIDRNFLNKCYDVINKYLIKNGVSSMKVTHQTTNANMVRMKRNYKLNNIIIT